MPGVVSRRAFLGALAVGVSAACARQLPTPPATSEPTPTAPTPAPDATQGPAPTATPDTAERGFRLTLGDRSWSVTARGPDAQGIEAALAAIAPDVARPARDARLHIDDAGTFQFTPAVDGVALDLDATADRVRRALADGKAEVELATRPVRPSLSDDQFAAARDLLAKILGRDPPVLTVVGGERSWTLDRAETAQLLALDFPKAAGSPVKLVLDEWQVRAFAQRLAKALDKEPVNARFALDGGKPKLLRDATPGRKLDQEATLAAFDRAIQSAGTTVELPLVAVPPAVSADAAAALAGAQLIESGSTPLGGAIPEKRWNVKLAAERLNGTVVPPGGTFSFNAEVGPTTLEAGFKWGFGITSGDDGVKTVPSVAGGICQVATTLFQPVFWAGYPLEERYWHLYWIPSYTSRGVVGLDVTVDADAKLDFKWINPTKTPVLIQASADDEKIVFKLYGTKPGWTVSVDPPRITNRVPADPTPLSEEDPTMPWGRSIVVEAARDGFDVEVVRRVTSPGQPEPRVLTLKSSYQPSHTVTLYGTAGRPPGAPLPVTAPAAATPAPNRPAGAPGAPAADATPRPPTPTPSSAAPAAPPTVTPAPPSPPATATPAPAGRTPTAPAKPAPRR